MLRAAFQAAQRLVDRVTAPLPAWMFLSSGAALLAMALLAPAWMETHQLRWKLEVMKLQASRLAEQQVAYQQFHEALAVDDPVLLERLAFYHLRLKPAGSNTLSAVRTASAAAELKIPTVEQMLHRPVPQPGVDLPNYQAPATRLIRLSTGPMRIGLIAAGIMCLVAGMTTSTVKQLLGEEKSDEAAPPVQARRLALPAPAAVGDPAEDLAGFEVDDENADSAFDEEVDGELDNEPAAQLAEGYTVTQLNDVPPVVEDADASSDQAEASEPGFGARLRSLFRRS